jgi:hypothetical protein
VGNKHVVLTFKTCLKYAIIFKILGEFRNVVDIGGHILYVV